MSFPGILSVVITLLLGRAVLRYWDERVFLIHIWRQFPRPSVFGPAWLALGLVALLSTLLWQIPWLRFGWMHLFVEDGGNVLTEPIGVGLESGRPLGLGFAFLFLALLFVGNPFFARAEERLFRAEYPDWSDIAIRSVGFGLAHLIVGIPLAVALALCSAGFVYGWRYRTAYLRAGPGEALLESTAVHACYNATLIVLLAVLAGVLSVWG